VVVFIPSIAGCELSVALLRKVKIVNPYIRSNSGSIEGLGEWKAVAANRRQFLRLFLMQMQIRKTKVLATS
jgi:hypothetical protein